MAVFYTYSIHLVGFYFHITVPFFSNFKLSAVKRLVLTSAFAYCARCTHVVVRYVVMLANYAEKLKSTNK